MPTLTLLVKEVFYHKNHELRELCQSRILPHNDTVVTELSPGEFVIITPGESYAEQCSGERELTISLEPGVYHVIVHPYCTLTGNDWKIRGLITRRSNCTIDDLIVDLEPINLDLNIITVPDIHHAYKLPWMPLEELRRFNVRPLQPDDTVPYTDDEIHFKSTSPTVWINLVLTCLAIAAMFIIGRFLYKRYRSKSFRLSKRSAADLPAAECMIRINDTNDEVTPDKDDEKEKCPQDTKSTEHISLDSGLAEATYNVTRAIVM